MSTTASERLARLLALVPWLSTHDGVTIDECARHFGVSSAQLERDLWLLVVCGIPGYGPDQLVDIDFWDDGVIRVIDPQTLGRPLRLTYEEALSLLMALRMLAQVPGIEDRDAIVSAAAKLERLAVDAGSERFVAVQVDVPAEVTAAVDEALATDRELRIRYAAATRDEVTERTVVPQRLHVVDGVAYLEAYCRSAEARRTFRLDRVLRAEVGDPATSPGTDDAATTAPTTPPAAAPTVLLDIAPEARWLVDVHQATLEDEDPDGRARVRVPLLSPDWGVRLVLSLRGAAVAVAPPEFVTAVAQAARAAVSAYPDR